MHDTLHSKEVRSRPSGAARSRQFRSISATAAISPACMFMWQPQPHRGDERGRALALVVEVPRQRRRVATLDVTGGAPDCTRFPPSWSRQARELGSKSHGPLQPHYPLGAGSRMSRLSAGQQVEIVASLPCYPEDMVNRQRGKGVFESSIPGLQRERARLRVPGRRASSESCLQPAGAVAPAGAGAARSRLQAIIAERYGIVFNACSRSPACRSSASARCSSPRASSTTTWAAARRRRAENLGGVMCR